MRGGVAKIRCLAARRDSVVGIEMDFENGSEQWRYELYFNIPPSGDRTPRVQREKVTKDGETVLDRPNQDDRRDELRLTETHLEQISANADFRVLAEHLQDTKYLHLVPQLVRHPKEFSGPGLSGDPFGRAFLEQIARTAERTRKHRLGKIEQALQCAVPQLKQLTHVIDTDEGGVPHLEAVYEHWRPNGAKQREVDFSDGTLRLIGLLWSLLDGRSMLLLEEPELSLHTAIVRQLPEIIWRLQKQKVGRRQVIVSTHSHELLSSRGISGEETLLLTPSPEGTSLRNAADVDEVRVLLESGLSVSEAVLPFTESQGVSRLSDPQLQLFDAS